MHIAWFEYFQILSLITAIYCWKGLKSCSLLAFIPLLVIVNATELIADNYRAFGWSSNYRIYNLYLLLSTPFFFYLAGKMLFLTRKESDYLFYSLHFMHGAHVHKLRIYTGTLTIQFLFPGFGGYYDHRFFEPLPCAFDGV